VVKLRRIDYAFLASVTTRKIFWAAYPPQQQVMAPGSVEASKKKQTNPLRQTSSSSSRNSSSKDVRHRAGATLHNAINDLTLNHDRKGGGRKSKFFWCSLLLIFAIVIGHVVVTLHLPEVSFEDAKKTWTTKNSKWLELKVDDAYFTVHYTSEGSSTPRSGKTLLFIHGSIPSLHTWDLVIPHLAENYKLIRLDLPGWGLTKDHPNFIHDQYHYTAFLHAFIQATQLDKTKVTLIGHSLGGIVSWLYAYVLPSSFSLPLPPPSLPFSLLKQCISCSGFHPEIVEGLILISSATPYPRLDDFPPTIFLLSQLSDSLSYAFLNFKLHHFTPRWFLYYNLYSMVSNSSSITSSSVDRLESLLYIQGRLFLYIVL
jgi:pimeloyl-ACP methyl ester carboxylesterase